ncbi:MFS transporter [Zobellella denitrificans]
MKHPSAIHVLLCCQFLATFGVMVLIPVMPLYLEKLTDNMSTAMLWAGIALAAPAIGGMLSAPLLGCLADRWGYRPILFLALGGFCGSLLLMSFAGTLAQFLAARLLLGFCGISLVITAYTAHMAEPSGKGMLLGRLQSAVALACLSGPLLGGLCMDRWGMEPLLNVTAAMTCVALVAAALCLHDASPRFRHRDQPEPPLRKRWFCRWPTLSWLAAGALAQGGAFALVTCFALYVSELGDPRFPAATLTGGLHALAWAATFLAGSYWGKRNDRGGARGSFVMASAGCGSAILAMLYADSLWQLALLRLVQGFCLAALTQTVVYIVSNRVHPRHQGQAIGTANSALVSGQLIGPLAVTAVYPFFHASGAMAASAALFIAAGLLLLTNKHPAYSTCTEATRP